MKAKFASALAVLLVTFSLFSVVPFCLAKDSSVSYQLQNPVDGMFSYRLNVVIPQTLNSYYEGLSHRSARDSDFPKFATSGSLQPVADCLREIYPDDEEFANGVLTLVHQIPYVEMVPAYYPTETMVRNSGDCDLLSTVAASILKAGGLDVVLLHYVDQEHMNLAVRLTEAPRKARLDIYSLEIDNETYYVAEATSNDWQEGWRVGECPDDIKDTDPQVITLENSEQVAPGQVSASFTVLESTTLTLNVASSVAVEGSSVVINGKLSPPVPHQNIMLYVNSIWSPLKVLHVAVTDDEGAFAWTWRSNQSGIVAVRASWTGNEEYAGTISETQNLTILPLYFIAAIAAAVIAASVGTAVAVNSRRKRAENLPPPPPNLPPPHQV